MTREPDFNMPVMEVGWSTRVANVMELYGLQTLGNVARMTRSEWMNMPNISRVSVKEIEATLKEYGLWLGYRAPTLQPQRRCITTGR
jgi:DNA-directed RNA polymerase alpha subunit